MDSFVRHFSNFNVVKYSRNKRGYEFT